mgnify:CR=1 FL=1
MLIMRLIRLFQDIKPFIGFFLIIFSSVINADEMRPALVQIDQVDDSHYQILWKVPARGEMKLKLSLLLDGQQPPTRRESYFVAGSYIERWQIARAGGVEGLHLEVNQATSKLTDIIIRYQSLKGEVVTGRINASQHSFTFPQELSYENVVKTYTMLGIEHILIGLDHLLFVACLVLIAGVSSKLFWAITGFTISHSVTLAVSSLGIFSVPIAPLEAVIALSIIFLAVEIAKRNKASLTYRYPVVVSSSFGLLHGFGFAAVLAEIGLPSQDFISALLFFNVGVEIGQLLFIGAIILLLAVLQKFKNLNIKHVEHLSSYAIGSVAVFWCIERILAF